MSGPPATLLAIVGDALGAFGIPGGNLASRALEGVFRRRAEQARDILLDELRHGERILASAEVEETVAVLYRYARAAHEGTARLNLRLLAKIIANQADAGTLRADTFLSHADRLVALRRDEIVVLGCLVRHWLACAASPEIKEEAREAEALRRTRAELVPGCLADEEEFEAALAATMRTGLLSAAAAWGGMSYRPTRQLLRIAEIAPFEAAVGQEPA